MEPSTYQLSTVQSNDYFEIMEVWEAAVRASHHFLTEKDIQYFKPLILAHYLDQVELTCVRDKTGNILGFMGLASGKMEMLFIHPMHHGQGLGRFFVENTLKRYPNLLVDVNEQNPQAADFYRHLGFITYNRSPLDGQGKPFPILHLMMPESIYLALAEQDDLTMVADLMEAFNHEEGLEYDKSIASVLIQQFTQSSALGRLWLIYQEQRCIGYIVLTFGFSFEYQGRDAFIDEFYILPAYRKRGIGKWALTFVLEQANFMEVKAVHLEVETANLIAQHLYKKLHFKNNQRQLLTTIL